MFRKSAQSLSSYYFAIIIAYVIWAAAGPVIRLTVQSVPPITFLFFRFLIVCVLLLPYAYYLLKTNGIAKSDYFKIFLLGVFSQTSILLVFYGYKYTTALEGTIIGMLGPIMSVAAGHYFYHEKVDWHVKLGMLLAALGTMFVAIEPILLSHGVNHSVELRLFGNLMIILYSLSFLLYLIWSKITLGINSDETKRTLKIIHMKPMKKHYSPALLATLTFYVGLFTVIPMFLFESAGYFGTYMFSFHTISTGAVLGILYMAIFSSIAAFFLFEWGLTKVEVKDTALFSYLQPVFTLPFAYVLLDEIPNRYMLLGSSIIALGVLIAEKKKN